MVVVCDVLRPIPCAAAGQWVVSKLGLLQPSATVYICNSGNTCAQCWATRHAVCSGLVDTACSPKLVLIYPLPAGYGF